MKYVWYFEVTDTDTYWKVSGNHDMDYEDVEVFTGAARDLAAAIEDAYEAVGLDRPLVLDPNGDAEGEELDFGEV